MKNNLIYNTTDNMAGKQINNKVNNQADNRESSISNNKSINKVGRNKYILHKIYDQRYLLIFVLPCIIWFIIFSYIPMCGIIVAFKNYNLADGFLHSPWVGFKYFGQFFRNYYFKLVMRNTVCISFIKLALGTPIPIIFALLLNEMKSMTYKRITQTISYLPHFLSWVVVLGIVRKMLSIDGGVVNQIIIALGGQPRNFLSEPGVMWPLAYITEVWKEAGWGAIIYLAALTSIDVSLYEAAIVDGANRFQKIWHISLPGIRATITIIFILSVSNIFNSNFDQLYLLGTPPVIDKVEVIDTYIYRNNLQNFQYSLGTAVGLFKSALNIALLFIANKISKSLVGEGLL